MDDKKIKALEAARDALTKRMLNKSLAPLRLVFVCVLREKGVLLVGVSDDGGPPGAETGRRVKAVTGDIDVEIVRAKVTPHNGGAGGQRIRPLQGGIQITEAEDNDEGTLGLVVISNQGQRGFLTAGHFMGSPGTAVGQPDLAGNNIVGSVVYNWYLGAPFNIDAAFVGLNSQAEASVYRIWTQAGGLQVTQVEPHPEEGQLCVLQGAVSGTQNGSVYATDVAVDVEGTPVVGTSFASYASAGGDSGGPVVSVFSGGTVELIGIHSGVVTIETQWGVVTYSYFTQVGTINSVFQFHG